jgi:tetratricopeptide (TPR) repeat protein
MNKKAIKSFKQAIRLDPDNTTEIRIQGQWENTVKEMSYYYLGVNYSLIFDDIDSALEQYYILYDLDIELAKELLDVIYIEE